jgi:hypothetical protein
MLLILSFLFAVAYFVSKALGDTVTIFAWASFFLGVVGFALWIHATLDSERLT